MENQVIFKTSTFGGFDKKEVMAYIYEATAQAQETQAKLASQMQEFSLAREEFQKQLQAMKSRTAQLEGQLESESSELKGERSRLAEMNGIIIKLTADLELKNGMLAAREKEVTESHARQQEMAERVRIMEESSASVEAAKIQLGSLLVEANAKAAQSMKEAEEKARKIVDEAEKKAGVVIQNALSSMSSVFEKFTYLHSQVSQIKTSLNSTVSDMMNQIDTVDRMVADTEKTLQEGYNAIEMPENEPVVSYCENDQDDPAEDFEGEDATDGQEVLVYPSHKDSFFRLAADE